MGDPGQTGQVAGRIQGVLYAVLYGTVRYHFLGASINGWLKNLPLFLALFMLLLRWPIVWPILMVVLALLMRLLTWKARRDGFVRFMAEAQQQPRQDIVAPADNEKVTLWATGTFSVRDWEEYVLGSPAEYWRVPMGDHAIMVTHSSGRFLYQFIRAGALETIQAGLLCQGTQSQEALAITFLTTWGMESDDVDFMFYAPSDEHHPSRVRQRIFLAFQDEGTRDSVWYNLLRAAEQPS